MKTKIPHKINPISGKPFKNHKLAWSKCRQCGIDFEVEAYRIGRVQFCGWSCKQKAAGLIAGRIQIENKRGTGYKTYVKENGRHQHRVVMERVLGRALVAGEIVHHVNGNKKDNRPENLQVMTQSEHTKLHLPEMMLARKLKAGY